MRCERLKIILYHHAYTFLLLQAQYIFIHNALDELLTCGDTEVAAANKKIVINKVFRPGLKFPSISGFQKQYEVSNTSIFSRLIQILH